MYLTGFDRDLSTVVVAALAAITALGAVCGSVIPLALDWLGLDAATVAPPAVTTLIDALGIVIYLTGCARVWLLARRGRRGGGGRGGGGDHAAEAAMAAAAAAACVQRRRHRRKGRREAAAAERRRRDGRFQNFASSRVSRRWPRRRARLHRARAPPKEACSRAVRQAACRAWPARPLGLAIH